MTGDEILERLLEREAQALASLDAGTLSASLVVKGVLDVDAALYAQSSAVEKSVLAACWSARIEAAKSFADETGIVGPPVAGAVRADDERALRAATFYSKAWLRAMGNAADGWSASVDRAHEATSAARKRIACFETVRAFNDERRTRATAAGEEWRQRWFARVDEKTCKVCKRLNGSYADKDGSFPDDLWPPVHGDCRCIVLTEARSAKEEQGMANSTTPKAAPMSDAEDGLITRAMHVKAIDEKKRYVDFVASTDVVDAHDEIIDQASWQLDDFLKNPVVLFAHQSRELPIGRAVDVGVRSSNGSGMRLESRIEFAPEELNPKAEQVFRMLQAGFLKAVSVGFLPKTGRWEMRSGVEVFVWADCVLKEISVTPVPANPEALAKMKALVPRANTDVSHAVERLREMAEKSRAPASGASNGISQAAPATTIINGAAPQKEETVMSEAAEKSLQEKLDKQSVIVAELKLEAKTAGDRAEKAEAAQLGLEQKLAAHATEKAAFETQLKAIAEQRDAAIVRADAADAVIVEQEVEALVGKKITPAEKSVFLELRKSNSTLFAKMIEQRTPLALEGTVIAGKGDANGIAKGVSGTADLLAEINTGL